MFWALKAGQVASGVVSEFGGEGMHPWSERAWLLPVTE